MVGRVQTGRERFASSACACAAGAFVAIALGALGIAATVNSALPQAAHPLEEEEEYGEFLARHEELATVPVNDIVKSIRMNGSAMLLGKKVYDKACASCHGADLKGAPGMHAPDLTDADWQYSGDDLPSGGLVKFPSDVEWTVRYGIRSGASQCPRPGGGHARLQSEVPHRGGHQGVRRHRIPQRPTRSPTSSNTSSSSAGSRRPGQGRARHGAVPRRHEGQLLRLSRRGRRPETHRSARPT